MNEAKLVILRHGESFGNLYSPFHDQERLNFLTPKGVSQADSVEIPDIRFSRFYASELTRSQHTLITVMKRIDQGMELNRIWISPLINESGWGETVPQLHARSRLFLEHDVIPALQTGENILVVSHHFFMQSFFQQIGYQMPDNYVEHCLPYVFSLSELKSVDSEASSN